MTFITVFFVTIALNWFKTYIKVIDRIKAVNQNIGEII